jgi:hypothetical protein
LKEKKTMTNPNEEHKLIPRNAIGGLLAGYEEREYTLAVYVLAKEITVNQLLLIRSYINKLPTRKPCFIFLRQNSVVKC